MMAGGLLWLLWGVILSSEWIGYGQAFLLCKYDTFGDTKRILSRKVNNRRLQYKSRYEGLPTNIKASNSVQLWAADDGVASAEAESLPKSTGKSWSSSKPGATPTPAKSPSSFSSTPREGFNKGSFQKPMQSQSAPAGDMGPSVLLEGPQLLVRYKLPRMITPAKQALLAQQATFKAAAEESYQAYRERQDYRSNSGSGGGGSSGGSQVGSSTSQSRSRGKSTCIIINGNRFLLPRLQQALTLLW